jgi:hypothetical protein
MTDDKPSPLPAASRRPHLPVRRPNSRIVTIKTTIASLIAAGAITAGLAAQMATGHDPALGGSEASGGASGSTPAQPEPPASDVGMSSAPEPEPVVTSAS